MTKNIRTVIEITASRLKVAQAFHGPRGAQMTFCRTMDIRGLDDISIANGLARIIREGKLDPEKGEIIAVIPRQYVIVRFLTLPSQDPDELRKMFELQLAPQLPYARSEVAADFMVISQDPSGYSKVMVQVVPLEIFMRHWSIYGQAKLVPQRVTISSLGIVDWFFLSAKESGVSALLDVDEDTSEVCIADGQRFLTSRQIPIGLAALREGGSDELVRQVEMTFSNYEKEKLGPSFGHIVTTSSLVDASSFKKERPGRQPYFLEAVPFLKDVQTSRSFNWPAEVQKEEVSVMAVCGLAMSAAPVMVDLIPPLVKEGRDRRHFNRDAIRAGLWLLAMFVSVIWAVSLPVWREYAKLSKLENELKSLKPALVAMEAKSGPVKALGKFIKTKLPLPQIIQELYKIIPQSVVLGRLDVTDSRMLVIEGYSTTTEDISSLQSDLGRSPVFSDVKVEYINKRASVRGEVNYFKINCQIKGDS